MRITYFMAYAVHIIYNKIITIVNTLSIIMNLIICCNMKIYRNLKH